MRHPPHAAVVHFPIALLGTSLIFDLAGLLRQNSLFWAVAFWNIALGVALGLLTVVTGLIDSARVPAAHPASATVTRHMVVMLGAFSCYGFALFMRGGAGIPIGDALVATLIAEGLGVATLLFGGWLGGELVYRHGVGREVTRH